MSEFIINSDQLERLIEGIEHKTGREINRVVCDGKELPSIVRCRDCKHRAGANVQAVVSDLCMWLDIIVKPDGFCAWGNRVEFVTCKCGQDIEAVGEMQVCPSCGRKVYA